MSISSLFADLDLEKLEENEETGALIEWLRQELRKEDEKQEAGPADEGTLQQGEPE